MHSGHPAQTEAAGKAMGTWAVLGHSQNLGHLRTLSLLKMGMSVSPLGSSGLYQPRGNMALPYTWCSVQCKRLRETQPQTHPCWNTV